MGLTEIIISLVDEASSGFSDIANNAETAFTNVEESADTASNTLDGLNQNTLDYVNTLDGAFSSIDTSGIDNLASAADNAGISIDSIQEAAAAAGAGISGIDPSQLEQVASDANDAADGLNNAADSSDSMSQAAQGVAAAGLGAALVSATNSAGDYDDSMKRIGVTQNGLSESVASVGAKWDSTITDMTNATGRGAGGIRTFIGDMGNVGVHSVGSIKEAFNEMSGAAVASGNPIEQVESMFERVVSTGTLGTKQLTAMGLTTADLGMTTAQATTKMKGMTDEQRAAFMENILNTAKVRAGTEDYKTSWQHVTDTLSNSLSYAERIGGALLLPLVTPAVNDISKALNDVAGYIDQLHGPTGNLIKDFLTAGAVLMGLIAIIVAAGAAYSLLNIGAGLSAAKTILLTGYTYAQIAASTIYNGILTVYNTLLDANLGSMVANTASRVVNVASTVAGTVATTAATVATGAMTAAQWLLNVALDANPIGLIIIVIVALVAILYELYTHSTIVRNAFNVLWTDLKAVGAWIAGAFMNTWKALVTFFSTMPQKVLVFLLTLLVNIHNWEMNMIHYAESAGSGFLNGVVSFITSLPSRVWSLLLQVVSRVISFASSAGSAARNAGSRIISGIQSTISALPGEMASWGEQAITSFVNSIVDAIPGLKQALGAISNLFPHSPPKEGPLATITEDNLYNWGQILGTKLSDGVNDGSANIFSNITMPSSTSMGTPATATATVPNSGINIDVPGLQTQTTAAQAVVASNVSTVTGQYNQLKINTGNSWTAMVAQQKSSFTTIKTSMADTLNSIVSNNETSYANMNNTTTSVLSNLQNQTSNSMGNVKSSWNSMQNSLVGAANSIKNTVGGDISNLSSNIGTFYNKVRNPGQFLAGHPTTSFNRQQLNLFDNASRSLLNPNGYYAGWDNSTSTSNAVMSDVDSYTPNFGSLGSLGMNVGTFKGTSNPPIGMNAFEQIAGSAIGKTAYQFYYNSKGGDPKSIFDSGSFNCYDGALIMLAMASEFGLNGHMQTGLWDNIPHAWAVINGTPMDTTAYQDGYGWTSPKVNYSGGSVSVNTIPPNNDEPIQIDGSIEHNLNINLEGVPDGIDQKALENILKGMIKDPEILKAIIQDNNFMNTLKTEIARKVAATKRAYGA